MWTLSLKRKSTKIIEFFDRYEWRIYRILRHTGGLIWKENPAQTWLWLQSLRTDVTSWSTENTFAAMNSRIAKLVTPAGTPKLDNTTASCWKTPACRYSIVYNGCLNCVLPYQIFNRIYIEILLHFSNRHYLSRVVMLLQIHFSFDLAETLGSRQSGPSPDETG